MTKVALYIRVSTVEQAREGYSLAAQEKVLRGYCKLKKYQIVNVYSDEGISGSTITKRPGMLKMLEDARTGAFNIILVWKLTRFSRSLKDLLNTCDELEKIDIYLESYSEKFDGRTPAGRLMRGVIGLIAQFERDVLSENVTLGLNERAARGLRTCAYILGYDVIKGGDMAINEKEAEIVRFIFDSYMERKSLSEVAALCREKKYTGKLGRVFVPFVIENILRRFTYCGYYAWHGKPVPVKGNFKPVITVEQYNKVQKILKAQGKLTGRRRVNELILLPSEPGQEEKE